MRPRTTCRSPTTSSRGRRLAAVLAEYFGVVHRRRHRVCGRRPLLLLVLCWLLARRLVAEPSAAASRRMSESSSQPLTTQGETTSAEPGSRAAPSSAGCPAWDAPVQSGILLGTGLWSRPLPVAPSPSASIDATLSEDRCDTAVPTTSTPVRGELFWSKLVLCRSDAHRCFCRKVRLDRRRSWKTHPLWNLVDDANVLAMYLHASQPRPSTDVGCTAALVGGDSASGGAARPSTRSELQSTHQELHATAREPYDHGDARRSDDALVGRRARVVCGSRRVRRGDGSPATGVRGALTQLAARPPCTKFSADGRRAVRSARARRDLVRRGASARSTTRCGAQIVCVPAVATPRCDLLVDSTEQ